MIWGIYFHLNFGILKKVNSSTEFGEKRDVVFEMLGFGVIVSGLQFSLLCVPNFMAKILNVLPQYFYFKTLTSPRYVLSTFHGMELKLMFIEQINMVYPNFWVSA